MTSIRRQAFIQEFLGGSFTLNALRQEQALKGLNLDRADLNHNGKIDSPEELNALFSNIDRVDTDGNANELRLDTSGGSASASGRAIDAMRRVAASTPFVRSPYHDIALGRTFTTELTEELARGPTAATSPRGPRIVALQYALTRLNLLHSRIDGQFGGDTERALRRFQDEHHLPVTGTLTHETLSAIDAIVSQDRRSAAARATDPFTVLNDFSTLTPLTAFTGTPVDFNNPSVQAAYRRFVVEYWPIIRDNISEMDCKTVSLLLITQFRRMVTSQLHVTLPMPRSADHKTALPAAPWYTHTVDRPRGLFSRLDGRDGPVRPGYDAVRRVEALDPTASIISGVNLRNEGITADTVARVAQPLSTTVIDNHGDTTIPEVDVNLLQPGDMLLLNHNKGPKDPDRTFDHCVTVVGVERDAEGRVTSLRLAVGSFDDMKDADSTTPPTSAAEINFYMEELQVSINPANGRITGSQTTWTSEGEGLMAPRYSHTNTLMELHSGGTIFAGRFGS